MSETKRLALGLAERWSQEFRQATQPSDFVEIADDITKELKQKWLRDVFLRCSYSDPDEARLITCSLLARAVREQDFPQAAKLREQLSKIEEENE